MASYVKSASSHHPWLAHGYSTPESLGESVLPRDARGFLAVPEQANACWSWRG